MKIDSKLIKYIQFRSGHWDKIDGGVIVETPFSLTVNGEVWLTFMCTPNYLVALALGFLYNEGVIESLDDVVDFRLCPTEDNLDVWLHQSVEKPKEWKRTSGCTGGYTAADITKAQPLKMNGYTINPQVITTLVEKLFESQDLYRKVGGVHTSILSDGYDAVVMAEDIGRHNSLDKLAGRLLLEDHHLSTRILLTTGRISSEMLQKSARMRAPFVISRTSPSSLSIELADQLGITMIGYARRDRFNLYSHPERIVEMKNAQVTRIGEFQIPITDSD
jgi:FdhD protein